MELTAEGRYLLETITKKIDGIESKVDALAKSTAKNTRSIVDIEQEYPLLPAEADDLSKAVRRRGVGVLGGKDKPAYKNAELRQKIYKDIYLEIKRQYGLIDEAGRQASYKKLKRKYLQSAITLAETYEAPIALANEIDAENDLEDMDD